MDPRAQQGTLPGRGAQAPVPRPPQEMGPRKPASLQTLCPCACSGNQIPRVGVGAGKVLSQIKWYLGRQTSLGTILTFPVWSRVISAASICILSFLNFEFFLGFLRPYIMVSGSWDEESEWIKESNWIQPHAYQCLDSFRQFEDTDAGSLCRESLFLGFHV